MMPTATILGRAYPTAVLPDGKEWMLENLAYPSLGELSGGGAEFGRLYSWSDCDTLRTLLEDGWRIPEYRVATVSTEWQDLFVAAGISGTEGRLRNPSLTYWAEASNGENLYGFDLRGGGVEGGSLVTIVGRYWYLNNPGNPVGEYLSTNWVYNRINTGGGYVALNYSKCSLRLVRDYTPTVPYTCPPPQVSATFRGMAPVETVTFASGRSRRVSRGTQAFYLDATFQWTFTYEEYEAFVAWWDDDLAYGTLPTTVLAPWGDTEQEHSFTFRGKYSVTRDDFSMKVSAPVRITDFHTTINTSFGDLYQTAPVEYPTELPVPQMDVREKIAQLRTDVQGNAGGSSSPLAYRGFVLDLSWSLAGLELDQFVVWFANCLRCGQRKFKVAIGPLAEMVYTVLGEPTVSISGVDRRVSMTVQAVLPVTLPSSVIPMYVDTVNASLDQYVDTVNNTLDQYVDTVGA